MSDLPKPGAMLCYGPDYVAHVTPDTADEEKYLQSHKFQAVFLSNEELVMERNGVEVYMGEHCDTPSVMRNLRLAYAWCNADIARRIAKVAPIVTTTTVGE